MVYLRKDKKKRQLRSRKRKKRWTENFKCKQNLPNHISLLRKRIKQNRYRGVRNKRWKKKEKVH